MRTVYKYPFEGVDVCLWALVDPEAPAPLVRRRPWKVLRDRAEDLPVPNRMRPGTVVYLDPPYQGRISYPVVALVESRGAGRVLRLPRRGRR